MSLLFLFFFMEETNWSRDHSSTEDLRESNAEPKTVEGVFDAPAGTTTIIGKDGAQVPKLSISPSHGQGDTTYTKKSYWAKLRIINPSTVKTVTAKSLFRQVTRPLIYLQLPVVVFCGISVGCYQMWLSFLNGTESSIMSDSYGFSTLMLGVPFVSPIIFAFIG